MGNDEKQFRFCANGFKSKAPLTFESVVYLPPQFNGKPLEHYAGQTIKLLVGDYIASGNLGWRGQTIHFPNGDKVTGLDINSLPIKPTTYKLRDSVLKNLRASHHKTIDIRKDGRIKLSRMSQQAEKNK